MAQDERGQVVPLAAVALVLAGVLALGVVAVARTAGGSAAAQAAADAAALAAVTEGRAGAARVAEANGASLTGYATSAAVVTVTVRRGCCSAESSAAWSPDDATAGARSACADQRQDHPVHCPGAPQPRR